LPSALPDIEHILMRHQHTPDISDRPREGLILRALKAAGLIKH